MKKSTLLSFLTLTINLAACTDSKLPKYVELNDLRVLTLISDKPEVNPGETVTITPIISDVNETTGLTYESFGCIDPGIALGASATCLGNPTKLSLSQGAITTATNPDMAQNFTGAAPTFTAAIPVEAIIFNQRSEIEKTNGLSYLIEYKVTNSSAQSVSAIKRILVSNKTSSQKNSNPTISLLQSNGTTLGSKDFPVAGKFTLSIVFTPNSYENYTSMKDDGTTQTKSEELTTTWFITDGSLKFFRSTNQDVNEFTAPESVPTTRKSFLISISRDSRGGVAYKRVCGGC